MFCGVLVSIKSIWACQMNCKICVGIYNGCPVREIMPSLDVAPKSISGLGRMDWKPLDGGMIRAPLVLIRVCVGEIVSKTPNCESLSNHFSGDFAPL